MLFPINQDLANIFGRTDLLSDDSNFGMLWDSRFPDSQTQAWAKPGVDLGRPAHHPQHLRDTSAAPLDHKVGEIQGTRTIP